MRHSHFPECRFRPLTAVWYHQVKEFHPLSGLRRCTYAKLGRMIIPLRLTSAGFAIANSMAQAVASTGIAISWWGAVVLSG